MRRHNGDVYVTTLYVLKQPAVTATYYYQLPFLTFSS